MVKNVKKAKAAYEELVALSAEFERRLKSNQKGNKDFFVHLVELFKQAGFLDLYRESKIDEVGLDAFRKCNDARWQLALKLKTASFLMELLNARYLDKENMDVQMYTINIGGTTLDATYFNRLETNDGLIAPDGTFYPAVTDHEILCGFLNMLNIETKDSVRVMDVFGLLNFSNVKCYVENVVPLKITFEQARGMYNMYRKTRRDNKFEKTLMHSYDLGFHPDENNMHKLHNVYMLEDAIGRDKFSADEFLKDLYMLKLNQCVKEWNN